MQGNRLMLIIAVVAGVMATVLAFTYINTARSAIENQEPEPTVRILFVTRDLAANSLIDPVKDLRVDTIGALTSPGLARSAVKEDEREALLNKPINAPIPAGSPLLYSHLAPITDINLAPGARAMSIDVNQANLMGGILVPGDRVDIVVSYRRSQTPPEMPYVDPNNPEAALSALMSQAMVQSTVPSDWEAEEVLSNVRVIAVGEHLSVARQGYMYGGGGGGYGRSSTVTLEVTPQQALDLIRSTAGFSNPITLLLRPSETGVVGDDRLLQEE
jgi:pilus assembly protein CpaB